MARLPARPVDELPADYCMTLVPDSSSGSSSSRNEEVCYRFSFEVGLRLKIDVSWSFRGRLGA